MRAIDELELEHPPQFAIGSNGRTTAVTLDAKSYITLLIRANVIDPTLWPPGFQEGAAALARVRQIESSCIEQEGEFDWEKFSPAAQNEYDTLCVLLDSLQDGDGGAWEAYKAGREENRN